MDLTPFNIYGHAEDEVLDEAAVATGRALG